MIKGATLELDCERVTLSSRFDSLPPTLKTFVPPNELPKSLLITDADRRAARARLEADGYGDTMRAKIVAREKLKIERS